MEEKDILYPKGIKWTKQRKDVYHVLLAADEPLSAVQIYNRILVNSKEEGYAVSTIYRILAAFEEKGFVEKSTFMGDGTVMYEWNKGGHTHYAVCLNCHKKVALQACPFEHLHLDTDMGNFMVTGHKLELYGYCKECEKSGKNSGSK
ncbi:MAG: transcriptional repressor [Lachnospiraceae bacterium]|nr:transcriptional repressor [Lachnospiraceae bacterium]